LWRYFKTMKNIHGFFLLIGLSLKIIGQPFGYQYGKVITINSAVVSGTNNLSDFPFLFKVIDADLRSVANGGYVSSNNGYDILFTDASCGLLLQHDLEKYDPINGELVCWIRLPTLNYTVNTQIHIYYGNPTVTVPTSTPQTWSADFSCVLHLGNNPTTVAPQMLDATSAANSGTCQGSMTATNSVAGKIGTALQFDEVDDAVSIADFDYTQSFTISFWFYLSEVNGIAYQYMFSHGNFSAQHSTNIYIGEDNVAFAPDQSMLKNIFQDSNDGTNTSGLDATTAFVNSFWHYYTFVVGNSGGATVYVDGIQRAYLSILGGNAYNPTTNIFLGARSDLNVNRFLGGQMDEFRILNVPRSADWVATEYNNQNSPATYYSLSAQTSASIQCLVLPVELIYFSAESDGARVELKWETASEKNNYYFTVERCLNGIDFKNISNVPGAGTTTKHHNYTYIDESPLSGVSYYRLKQTDYNGRENNSRIAVVSLPDMEEEILITPNPSDGEIVLQLPKKFTLLKREISIFNEMGALVYTSVLNEGKDSNKYELNLNHLGRGFYYLQVNELTPKRYKFILM